MRRIDIDANLSSHAADTFHSPDAAHAHQTACDHIVDEPGQLFFVHAVGMHRVRPDDARGRDLFDDGFAQILWQIAAYTRDGVAGFVDGIARIFVQLELNGGDRAAGAHDRGNVSNLGDSGDRVLNPARHL